MADLVIRRAHLGDAAQIAEIYNHYVLHSTATFDVEPKTAEDRVRWLGEHDDLHPVLVGTIGGEVVAWGSLTRWSTKPAYRHTVEISTYVNHEFTGRGIGPAISEALVAAAREAGHHAVIGQIVAENAASLRTSENLGFERVGVLREVGRKFERWLDVVLMERPLIGPFDQEH